MRYLIAAVIALGLSGPVLAQSDEIEANIRAQIDAFRADDFTTAFTYASPTIRDLFRTPENFGSMVQNGYPMVWRPGSLRFLELREIAGNLWQKVMVTDAQGRVHILDYQMVQLEDGWKINGVQILGASDPSV
ncbi:DUF4864 domain-containing protein [Lutimaribacter marinistellae]|uniref:DUF4864 domain-containing protein n=1 Tax=Lutimaribacter marinistellae TaxID=1820329 RepID=A0ABV7T9U2_9RHOB